VKNCFDTEEPQSTKERSLTTGGARGLARAVEMEQWLLRFCVNH